MNPVKEPPVFATPTDRPKNRQNEFFEVPDKATVSFEIPETIELNFKEAVVLERQIPALKTLGIEIEPFGGNTFMIKSVPAILSNREIRPVLIELVGKMIDDDFSGGIEEKLDQCLIVMACHSVIRARQSLSDPKIRSLLEQLDACDTPSFCPHGRLTFIQWTKTEIEKKFGRIV